MANKTLAVDFDGVISKYEGWKGLGNFGPLIDGCVEELAELRKNGWTIVVFTTRGLDIKDVVQFLDSNRVPYDYVNRNAPDAPENLSKVKVIANVYLDDRAINFNGRWSGMADKIMQFKPYYLDNPTLTSARKITSDDLARLAEANAERRDAWRMIGMGGLFLDVRKQYLRVRSFLWERLLNNDPVACDKNNPEHERWRIKLIDILRDMRNYTLFLQILLDEKDYSTKYDSDHWSEMIANDYTSAELKAFKSQGYKQPMQQNMPKDL